MAQVVWALNSEAVGRSKHYVLVVGTTPTKLDKAVSNFSRWATLLAGKLIFMMMQACRISLRI
ncbi:hypothetical protein OH492_15390 [Vibrio chagasii]|nr:hypothetical protein [Vibrio chagasii]